MASTNPKTEQAPKEAKATKEKKLNEKERLTQDLERFYGVDYNDDDEAFIKAVSESSVEMAKRQQQADPIKEAQASEKIGRFRALAEQDKGKVKLTDEQKALQKRVADEYEGVSISFPDDQTWSINVGGKEDSGNMDVPEEAILASAQRLKKVPAGE